MRHLHTIGDVLRHKESRILAKRIDAHLPFVRQIVDRLHVSTPARQVIKDVRSRINKEDRLDVTKRALRKGVYRLALGQHLRNRDEFTRVTGHPVFDRHGDRYKSGGKSLRAKNLCAKTRKQDNPYEIWVRADWEWRVLKKWQIDDNKVAARWFVAVKSPHTYGSFELGDEYVANIKKYATKLNDAQLVHHLQTADLRK